MNISTGNYFNQVYNFFQLFIMLVILQGLYIVACFGTFLNLVFLL